MKTLLCAVWLLVSLGAAKSEAAGFALDLQSSRPMGMASAVTGFINDSSAIFFNAAGIAQGLGVDVQLGDTLILPMFNATTASGQQVDGKRELIPPLHAYATYGLTDSLTVGIGFFTPFGLVVAWPDDSPGRFLASRAELKTYNINPTVAYRFGALRVGAGINIIQSSVELQRRVSPAPNVEMGSKLTGDDWGFGANFGIQYEAIPNFLSLGASWRTRVKMRYKGTAEFTDVPPSPTLQAVFKNQPVSTDITLPDIVAFGVALRPTADWLIDFDAVWYSWQTFGGLDIRFPQTPSLTAQSYQPKRWKAATNYHLGTEYRVSNRWRARAGVLYDISPAPDDTLGPELPDSNRINFALGGGYKAGMWSLDAAYQYIHFLPRESTSTSSSANGFNPAEYKNGAHAFSLTVGLRL